MSGFERLSLATIVAAIGNPAMLIISAYALPNAVNLQFVTFWGLFFVFTGVLGGLMQETTRAIGAVEPRDWEQNREQERRQKQGTSEADQTLGACPITVPLGIAIATFITMAVTGPLWAPPVVQDDAGTAILFMVFGLALYSMQATTSGLLGDRQLWGPYAALIMIDILVRVALVLIVWYFGWGLLAWLIITVFGTVSWLILALLSPTTRSVMLARAGVPVRRFTTLMVTTMGVSGTSTVPVIGFPTIVKAAGEAITTDVGITKLLAPSHVNNFTVAVTIADIAYAVTLTRAPLLMPLEKSQNVIIVSSVRHCFEGVLAALARPLGALAVFGASGIGLAWPIGPWIMTLILDDSYHVSRPVFAALMLGATLIVTLMTTGSVTLVVEKHHMYLIGWLAATTIAVVILFLPGHLPVRMAAAIAVGSAVGVVIHLFALRIFSPKTVRPAVSEAFAVGQILPVPCSNSPLPQQSLFPAPST